MLEARFGDDPLRIISYHKERCLSCVLKQIVKMIM